MLINNYFSRKFNRPRGTNIDHREFDKLVGTRFDIFLDSSQNGVPRAKRVPRILSTMKS